MYMYIFKHLLPGNCIVNHVKFHVEHPWFAATNVSSRLDEVVGHLLRDREVVGSIPGHAIPKVLKWYQWLPCLVLSVIRQALASLLLTCIAQLASYHLQISPKKNSAIIIIVCIHRRTVCTPDRRQK